MVGSVFLFGACLNTTNIWSIAIFILLTLTNFFTFSTLSTYSIFYSLFIFDIDSPAGEGLEQIGSTADYHCQTCGQGKYSDQIGLFTCKNCDLGRYNSELGRTETCGACQEGHFAAQKGQTACEKCPDVRKKRNYLLFLNNVL